MNHIDLFSGIGGFALAAHWAGFNTEVFCERDEFCKKVLNKHWPTVPVISDIRDFDGRRYYGTDLLTGGFPCQPFSTAGKRRGDQDDRFLWPEMLRVISEARPHWIVAENVPGIINMALDDVLSDLEREGYETGTLIIPACAINAPHKRDRVWIVAHTCRNEYHGEIGGIVAEKNGVSTIHWKEDYTSWRISGASSVRLSDSADVDCSKHNGHIIATRSSEIERTEQQPGRAQESDGTQQFTGGSSRQLLSDAISHSDSILFGYGYDGETEVFKEKIKTNEKFQQSIHNSNHRDAKPILGRMADGLPGRMDGHFDSEPAHIPRISNRVPDRSSRLKALGNAIVPQVAYEILMNLKKIQSSFEE